MLVTVGVGAVATAEAADYSRHAESVGANCVMVLPPLYFDFSPESQIEHLLTIAKSTNLPVMLYDGAGGIAVPVAVIEVVARQAGNIRAVKLALPDPARVTELVRNVPDVVPLAGSDPTLVAALENGARGIAIATAMIQPEEIVALYSSFRHGDVEQAHSIFATAIMPSVVATSTPKHEFIARFKEVLLEQGTISSATVRRPLRSIDEIARHGLLTTMRELGVV
jgi:4-hydroxy-tetrahydrodipicolinate synthase